MIGGSKQDGNAARMRLLYITSSMPFGSGEAFLIPEVNELLRQGHQVLIVPRSPEGKEVVTTMRTDCRR